MIRMWGFRKKRSSIPGKQTTALTERRYAANSAYILPKDALENDRLNFQHHVLKMLIGKNYVAPLENISSSWMLDVGCGTGKWAIEMAQQFPEKHVIGVDIEVPHPLLVPPVNCQFVQGDVIKGLPFPNACFDYVHQRLLVAAIPARHWAQVIEELLRVTRHGGFIELVEVGNVFSVPGPHTQQFMSWWKQAEKLLGFDVSISARLDDYLRVALVQHVEKHILKVPLGKKAGRAGEAMGKDLQSVFRGLKNVLCTRLQIDPLVFDETIDALPEEWSLCGTTLEFYLIWGRK